jgi:hypothetical protein
VSGDFPTARGYNRRSTDEPAMTLNLTPELETALAAWAAIRQLTPDALVAELLEPLLLPAPPEPKSEFERKLLSASTPCGVALSGHQLSREVMYD